MSVIRRTRPSILIAAFCVVVIVAVSLFADVISPKDPLELNLQKRMIAPLTDGYLLGTDELGRDVFSRLISGGRVSLLISALAAAIAGCVGALAGVVAGYYGRSIDSVLARLADIQLAIPAVIFALIILSFGGGGFGGLLIALFLAGWPVYFRIARVEASKLRNIAYVESARLQGSSGMRIVVKHIAPSIVGVSLVTSTLMFSRNLTLLTTLSFLGVGVQPPTPDWGLMVSAGQSVLAEAWWLTVFPGAAIVVVVFSANLLGDGIAKAIYEMTGKGGLKND